MKTYNIDSGSKIRSRPPKNNNKTEIFQIISRPDPTGPQNKTWVPSEPNSNSGRKKILGICSAFPETIYMSYKCITWWMRLRRRSWFFQCSCTHTWTSWPDSSLLELVTNQLRLSCSATHAPAQQGTRCDCCPIPNCFPLGVPQDSTFSVTGSFALTPPPQTTEEGKIGS